MVSQDRKPLLAYLKVQEQFESGLLTTLGRAANDIDKELKRLAGKQGIGAAVRRDQLRLVLKTLLTRQAELWRIIGSDVQAGRKDAAASAVKTNFVYEDVLLRSGLSKAVRTALLRSAQATAAQSLNNLIPKLIGLSNYDLSKQVYKSRDLSNGLIDRQIKSIIARGGSWKDIADAVRGSINPKTPGGVSYAAKRLGRTELNNAFHGAAVLEARNSPYIIGMEWHLSGSHPRPDQCNDYADGGTYKPEDVPAKPHPQCLCYVTPVTPSRDEFLGKLARGVYDGNIRDAMA